MWDQKTPAITTSLRGLVYEEVRLTCADRDLHSGLFGGAAQNPLRVLSKILAAMHDDNGRVTIPGFYDGVPELPAEVKADLKALNLTPEVFLGQVGLKVPAGERDRMLIEQIATRPTAEINGIIGGYTGEGAKTVIPGKALGKVSFRLVGQQDPKKIREAFRAFGRRAQDVQAEARSLHAGDAGVLLQARRCRVRVVEPLGCDGCNRVRLPRDLGQPRQKPGRISRPSAGGGRIDPERSLVGAAIAVTPPGHPRSGPSF
jgi:acetylornithine deacetylase/succinyl-diaminopimelate desuccinylase-like protein